MKAKKHFILEKKEILERRINELIFDLIEELKVRFPNERLKILDWGCGRGATVGRLRSLGYDAFGVDVDEEVLNKAKPAFEEIGLKSETYLHLIDKSNQTQFESFAFHLIITEHVLEHVSDIDALLKEMSRLLAPGGVIYNVFPSYFKLIEPHLNMPFLQWIPIKFQKRLISFYLMIGLSPKWELSVGENEFETYYNYRLNKLFYRPISKWKKIFSNYDFSTKLMTLQNRTIKKLLKKFPLTLLPVKIIELLVSRFYIVHLKATKL